VKRWIVAGLVVAAMCVRAHAGDPTRVYKTVETDHFIIYYWEPLDDVARRVGVVAERAHRILSPALGKVPTEKTVVFMADDTDSANGFATTLPRNMIQLFATGPDGFSELDDHDDWLYGLVAHEYTHILHLDTLEGLPKIYNSIFGKTWAPNQIMPRWVIEGIAVYEESKRSAGGRDRGTRFDSYIRIARHADADLRLDEITGNPRRYPRGNAAYVYGSHFLRYVFDRFGDDKLREMAHVSGAYPIPFAVNRQIAKVVGKPFTELYDDWKGYLRDKYGMEEMAAERRGLRQGRALTHAAESELLPHYSADGKEVFWLAYDGYSLPWVKAMPVGGDATQARDVVQIDAMGPFDLLPDNSIVYEQGRQFRRDYSFEDVFRWDYATKQTTRITVGKRARDPAVSPDGRRVAYSRNEHSNSVLAVQELAPGVPESVVYRGDRYEEVYQPAWSPDGKRIAFSAWRNDGYRDILITELASGKTTAVTNDRAIDMSPAWSADGSLLFFDSDRTGISNIYAFDTAAATTWQVTNVLGGAFHGKPSPDGKRLVFENAAAVGGYDIYEIPLDRASWLPARPFVDDKPAPLDIPDDESPVSAARPYRALESLAPQVWTLSADTSSRSASIQTSGNDVVGLHNYTLAIGLDAEAGDTDIGASYAYTGWRPALRVSAARTMVLRGGWRVDGVNKTYKEEDWSGTLSLGIPLESRPSSSWTLSFDYDGDYYRLTKPPAMTLDPNMQVSTHPPTDYLQAGLATRLAFSRLRSTTFGLGSQDGFDASVSLRLDHPDFGAEFKAVTVSYALDAFQRLWGVSPVIGLRLVGAIRAGDRVTTGSFALGGVPPQDVAMSIVNSARSSSIGYLHGYPTRAVSGNQYHLANVEYRQELWRIEHGLSTLPIYLRRVHLGVLSDVATAYDSSFDAGRNVRWSMGAALRLDAYFGYFVPGTFEIGYARGLIANGIGESWFLLTGSL
jgi:Tol biopolymer transport system component